MSQKIRAMFGTYLRALFPLLAGLLLATVLQVLGGKNPSTWTGHDFTLILNGLWLAIVPVGWNWISKNYPQYGRGKLALSSDPKLDLMKQLVDELLPAIRTITQPLSALTYSPSSPIAPHPMAAEAAPLDGSESVPDPITLSGSPVASSAAPGAIQ